MDDFRPSAAQSPILDRPLTSLGFEYSCVSPDSVTGRLKVTEKCCQPFKVLHGGVSALIAESLASMGAYVASGLRKVSGVQLSINHIKPALIGDVVIAEAGPVQAGRTIQVWEVQLWKVRPSKPEDRVLISTSRVTLLCSPHAPENAEEYNKYLKKYARL